MIKIYDLIQLVSRYSFENKKRMFITISGIIIGIFTFTFFMFISQGMTQSVQDSFSATGMNVLEVYSLDNVGLTETDVQKIKQVVKDYNYISPTMYGEGIFEYSKIYENFAITAYDKNSVEDVFEEMNFKVQSGRLLKSKDKGVILIGNKIANEGFEDLVLKVGNSVKIDGKSFRIVGILEDKNSFNNKIFIPFEDLQDLLDEEKYHTIKISLVDKEDVAITEKAILTKMNPNSKAKNIGVETPTKSMKESNKLIGALTMIVGFISGIVLLSGGINVMNTMYSNIKQRQNEISVMKAMGSTNFDILFLFLSESAFLGLIGSLIGFVIAYGLALISSYVALNFFDQSLPIIFDPIFFALIIGGAILMTSIFGAYPAFRGSSVNPADHLRDD